MENNSEHWNALFLSLRELAEWTVKKEAELDSMGPMGGDESTIRQQQVRLKALLFLPNNVPCLSTAQNPTGAVEFVYWRATWTIVLLYN